MIILPLMMILYEPVYVRTVTAVNTSQSVAFAFAFPSSTTSFTWHSNTLPASLTLCKWQLQTLQCAVYLAHIIQKYTDTQNKYLLFHFVYVTIENTTMRIIPCMQLCIKIPKYVNTQNTNNLPKYLLPHFLQVKIANTTIYKLFHSLI